MTLVDKQIACVLPLLSKSGSSHAENRPIAPPKQEKGKEKKGKLKKHEKKLARRVQALRGPSRSLLKKQLRLLKLTWVAPRCDRLKCRSISHFSPYTRGAIIREWIIMIR
jgi:hypothetical protein